MRALNNTSLTSITFSEEVGNMETVEEDRSHFGVRALASVALLRAAGSLIHTYMLLCKCQAWCIVSSPLILSFDMRDKAKMERVWPIISNTDGA